MMKAIRINEFGGPEVMRLEEIDRPVPAADEILVRVYASGVNPVDCGIRKGGMPLKLPLTLGCDVAGVVEETGSNVTSLKKGDAVYGVPNFPGDGSYAEYCVAKENQFALKPGSLSFNEAAGVPLAGLTAWTALFEHGRLQSGQRILIQGASGGVGSLAVQFAKARGAFVIAMASTGNVDFLKDLGADEVIDYKTERFEDVVSDLDVVLEASPNRDNKERVRAVSVLKEGGTFVSVNIDRPFDEEVMEALSRKQAKGASSANHPGQEALTEMAKLIDAGKVKVVISEVFPLAQVAEAHRASETWHVRGKLVLEVRKES